MTTRVELTPEQMPEQLRPLLVTFKEAQKAADEATNNMRIAPVREKHHLQAPLDDANRQAAEAHVALLEATRENPTLMRDHAAAKFAACVERAREALEAADSELRAAAGHAAVFSSVRSGKPTVNTERAEQAPGKQRAMFSVSLLREVRESLPEDID
ncbi:hypothetical protein [Streptomyces adustus]|uniref:hypothetical protein n=1 Tax=Streptomyces adustus TaxID=1609272 RepID=UPI00370F771F